MQSLPDPVRTTLDLMAIDSTSGREADVVSYAERLLGDRGWATARIPVTSGRDCLFARGRLAPEIVFSTHLDTVPPFIAPRLDGDAIHGRGACDAKGIAASMLVAAERLRDEGVPCGLLFVIGEETNHDGAHAANAWARDHLETTPRVLVNGEPTDNTLALGTKGAQRVIVRTRGRAAHSAYPELGHSAISALVHLLAELETIDWPRDDMLGLTTVNIGAISGGVADNVIAPGAEARLMFRLVTPAADIQERVERWIDGRAELEWGVMVPPIRLGTIDGFATSVVSYATDIPALSNWGTPYLYGPGSIHAAHTPNECVTLASLARAVDDYTKLGRLTARG
ncbi:MAG TPA: M20/M25/M40 family metallo-hydrolase [Gemmatimonadaceae bacterium]|nr:M20/M25/M40 family metallo-hydrolase [Gemmatimonadaceae bacterium]